MNGVPEMKVRERHLETTAGSELRLKLNNLKEGLE
jgi:hypothetical protein